MADTLSVSGMNKEQALAGFSRSRIAMVLTDPAQDDNPIVYVNEAFERMTGYSRSAAVGRNCRFLQGEDTDPAVVARLRAAVEACEEISVEILNYRADGKPFWNRLVLSPITEEGDDCAMFVGLQIPVPETREGPGDVLDRHLREIQHRVKNHLSMIVGMIRMQARQAEGRDDFGALARRVESLQLLYEEMTLAGSDRSGDSLSLGSYLSRIANAIAHIDGRPGVRVNLDIAEMRAPLHTATQLGLVLSEALTNALQHAFQERDSGLITVSIEPLEGDGLRMIVADDGQGMPEGETWPRPGSLGGRIVENLASGMGGSITVEPNDPGTRVVLEIPTVTAQARD
ncbi:PAS domain-containing protein [Pseudoroseicyclus aestuarii]|uniref:PAS domain S-box-containing protein n=1 Tax=Pseudoroseicyclus aestuarii TaxID=1795041 RepID=A0A318ST32_9RHOB|nr:PAS domain-containing protein [Pseudoroseicyclus aestuarii]PYE84990.1 PAS domain S-box-containing protein [Pseudoroseicyclus aestuarii]